MQNNNRRRNNKNNKISNNYYKQIKFYQNKNGNKIKNNTNNNNNNINIKTNKPIENKGDSNNKNLITYQPLAQAYKVQKSSNNRSQINKQLHNKLAIEKKRKYNNGKIGLLNIGNTCYINSAIQNLKNVYPLTLYFLSHYLDFDPNLFARKYCELIANLINQDFRQYIEPREFVLKLCDVAPIFRFGQQNDSSFCIIYILNLLEKEDKVLKSSKLLQNIKNFNFDLNTEESNKFKLFLNKFNEKRNSFIIDYFYGFQKDIYQCNNKLCKKKNYTFQGISVLNLSIMTQNNNPIYTLEEAIKHYQYGQNHINEEGFYCPDCKNKKITTKSVLIYLPKILIINFRRIGEKDFYQHNVEIPEILEMNKIIDKMDYKYELTGFIKHIGGANSGHNIAICKNFFDNNWYEYNDSMVRPLNNNKYGNNYYSTENKNDTSDGFIFLYKKEEDIITEKEKNEIIEKSSELRK